MERKQHIRRTGQSADEGCDTIPQEGFCSNGRKSGRLGVKNDEHLDLYGKNEANGGGVFQKKRVRESEVKDLTLIYACKSLDPVCRNEFTLVRNGDDSDTGSMVCEVGSLITWLLSSIYGRNLCELLKPLRVPFCPLVFRRCFRMYFTSISGIEGSDLKIVLLIMGDDIFFVVRRSC